MKQENITKPSYQQNMNIETDEAAWDYIDCFDSIIHSSHSIGAKEFSDHFFALPKWVTILMSLRNAIVKIFGLKGEKRFSDLVKIESENIATISKDDKHLYLNVLLQTKNSIEHNSCYVSIRTRVKLHNRMGQLYFAVIKPFHRQLCKIIFKRTINALERTYR